MSYPYIMLNDAVVVHIDNKPFNILKSAHNYNSVIDAIKAKDWDLVKSLVDVVSAIKTFLNNKVEVVDGKVMYNGEVLHNSISNKILTMISQGFDCQPLILFLENLLTNPSKSAISELYEFLEFGRLPITEDGHFLAYKKVRSNYLDIHSGTFDNSVGRICEMERQNVNSNRNEVCSAGLHFCSFEYLQHFAYTNSDKVMILKINPKDVVSIPSDYNNTKGRCCKYEVIGEYTEYAEDPSKEKWEKEDVVISTKSVAIDSTTSTENENNILNIFAEYSSKISSKKEFFTIFGTFTNSQLTKIYNYFTEKDITKFRDKRTALERLYSEVFSNKPSKKIYSYDELIQKTNKELVSIYNELTNSKLVKFKDKMSGVARILEKQKEM